MANAIIFLYLIIFPFGQVFRLNLGGVTLQPLDLVAMVALIYVIKQKQMWPKYLLVFPATAFFSYLIFASLFPSKLLIAGLLYLFRLIANLGLIVFISRNFNKLKEKDLILNALMIVIVTIAIFGWLQYFLLPDFRSFTVWGWDDHLFRLIGTFFDPTFTGIILVLGFIMALIKKRTWLAVFFLITVAFTYSRASYVALSMSLMLYGIWLKKIKLLTGLLILFLVTIVLLPRPASEGVQLERTRSIKGRFTSYSEAMVLIKQNPLFGVGFNNYCYARQLFLQTDDLDSHACSGSDSSLLTILATTGVVGLLIFVGTIKEIAQRIGNNSYGKILTISFVSVLTHAFFSNSLFYSWVLGILAILAGLAIRNSKQ